MNRGVAMDFEDEDEKTAAISIPSQLISALAGKSGFLMVVGTQSLEVTGQMFKLTNPEMVLGRSPDADVRLNDDGISRKHSKFTRIGPGKFRVEDLGSTNGTFVNGERVEAADLKDGDKIHVGSTAVLLFSLHDEVEEQFTKRMFESATQDALTGLFNKKYFLKVLEKELAFSARHLAPLSLMLIDVDHFKKVNDTHGHPAGDAVLARLGERLSQLIRKEDLVARYGGEEFVALLRQADERSSEICGERCRTGTMAMPVVIGQETIFITISIGISTLMPGQSATCEALIAAADANLYQAKKGGRNRVVIRPFAG